MNSHQDDYLLKTSSKSSLQASHFALIKFLFAYFKQPKQIFLLKMEPSFDPFFAFFKQFNFYGVLGHSLILCKIIEEVGLSKFKQIPRKSGFHIGDST